MTQEFTAQLNATVEWKINDIHTVISGKIVSFDTVTCEAEILPFGKMKLPNGKFVDYPKLNNVPVLLFQSNRQKSTIVYPIKAGDGCLIFVSEVALDTFRNYVESNNMLKFDLSNAVAIVGLFSQPNKLMQIAVDENAMIIEQNETQIKLKDGGVIIKGNVTIDGILSVDGINMNTHTHLYERTAEAVNGNTSPPQ